MNGENMYSPGHAGDQSDADLNAIVAAAEDRLLAAVQASLDLDAGLAKIIGGPPEPGKAIPEEHWEPAISPREAAMMGIRKEKYDSAVTFARMAVEEHRRLSTPRDRWEPTPIQNHRLASPFIANAGH